MKTIGLLGGTSWLSTVDYYRIINATVNQRLGENEAARLLLYSVNYGEIIKLTRKDDWDAITVIIGDAAKKLEQGGAECLLLCANTMHRIAENIQSMINIPILHIAEVTASAIQAKGLKKVLLLGTRYTMQGDFYPARFKQYGIELLIPDEPDMDTVHNSIYDELGKNIFLPETRAKYVRIIEKYSGKGATGVIFGCTEIPLLLGQNDSPIPVFDTTLIHATSAVDFALGL